MQLDVALREWMAVCTALADGRLVAIVRKGGIHERRGGLFSLQHDRFLLWPGLEHQEAERLLPDLRPTGPVKAPDHFSHWAEAACIWRVEDRQALTALGDALPWPAAELDRRFAYRGEPWLAVVAVRVWRLVNPVPIVDHPSYGGCRSWVPLREAVNAEGSTPVLADAAWASTLRRFNAILGDP
jgi:hypothetical protein